MDYDPAEGYVFPQPIVPPLASPELAEEIDRFVVPEGFAALWYLGNSTFLLKSPQGTLAAVDPYLTDFCASKRSRERVPKSRLLPVFLEPEDLRANVVLITHSHCDHADPFTLERLHSKEERLFVAPYQCLPILRSCGIPDYAVLLIHPTQTLAFRDLTITATFAEPTDDEELNPVGYWVRVTGGPSVYFVGDTAESRRLGAGVRERPEVMCVCINGGYRNLGHWQAAELAARVAPKTAVPCHYDMMPHNLQSPHMFRKSLWENTRGAVEYCRMAYARPYLFSVQERLRPA